MMKAIVLEEPGRFRAITLDGSGGVPEGHALVRVRRVGICGTDWHAFHGRQPFFSYPRILGHELGVEIETVNAPETGLKTGDRCAVEPYLNCRQCDPCRRGRGNCCEKLQVLGVHVDGGMRERLLIPAGKLHRSEKLTLEQMALVETLAIGCHAAARAAVIRAEQVLILGAGPIGLSVIPFVQEAGGEVVVADVSSARLDFCRQHLHVPRTIDARGDLAAGLRAVLGGDLPTLVIDATGNPQSMAACFDLVAHGGRIVFVGLFQGEVTFNDPNFHRREITLLASRNALPGDFTRIIDLIERGRIDTTPWITHRAAAGDFLDALPQWTRPEAGLLKAMVEF
jgi:2-desacetyl-2-hydroxyethyl bacteriochlorophyllide A dehydrogenase